MDLFGFLATCFEEVESQTESSLILSSDSFQGDFYLSSIMYHLWFDPYEAKV